MILISEEIIQGIKRMSMRTLILISENLKVHWNLVIQG